MNKLVLLSLSLGAALTAHAAADWVVISQSKNGGVFHLNFDRYKYLNSEAIEAWVKMTHKPKSESQRQAKDEAYALYQYTFNCSNKSLSLDSFYSYGKNGAILASKHYRNPDFISVVPDSSGEPLYEAACEVHALIKAAKDTSR